MNAPRHHEVTAAASELIGRRLAFVKELGGGEHASTILAHADHAEYVIRRFPEGDSAPRYELEVLDRLKPLDTFVPRLIAYADHAAIGPIIVTTRVHGAHPSPTMSVTTIAQQMAAALARIHQFSGQGLRHAPAAPPGGRGPGATAAQEEWARLGLGDRVLTHYDFWCGNALWDGDVLSGVVDWSGARNAPRGVDVAWCRLDLVLLGSLDAADTFLSAYERQAGVGIVDMHAWDLQAAAQAESRVETWAPNYYGIGRTDLTAEVLRSRLDAWVARLLS